jgi:predicted lipid-binding transport protein (Tim44 family)
MRHLLIGLFAVVVGAGLTIGDAEAKRFNGGGNTGIQRSAPAPAKQATPAPANPSQAAPQPAGGNRWLGPIAGIAAGLGLAALASYLGLSEELGTIMMVALIAFAIVFVFRLLLRRFQPQTARPMQYAAAGRAAPHFETEARGANTAAPAYAPRLNVPADFDADNFIRNAKVNFLRLQAANDARDIEDIRRFTTPEMYAEIKMQLQERGEAPQQTDVVKLDAEVVDFATEFGEQIASVRFHGMIHETADADPEAFDEIWHITKPVDGARNWAIAGIQQSVTH